MAAIFRAGAGNRWPCLTLIRGAGSLDSGNVKPQRSGNPEDRGVLHVVYCQRRACGERRGGEEDLQTRHCTVTLERERGDPWQAS